MFVGMNMEVCCKERRGSEGKKLSQGKTKKEFIRKMDISSYRKKGLKKVDRSVFNVTPFNSLSVFTLKGLGSKLITLLLLFS